MWSQAGGSFRMDPAGRWWAVASQDDWPQDDESQAWIKSKWVKPYGDRRQEVVMIGVNLDETAVRRELDRCLLTDQEFAQGPDAWESWADPFPHWSFTNASE